MKTPRHLENRHPKKDSSESPMTQLAKRPYSAPTVEEAGSVFSNTKTILGAPVDGGFPNGSTL